MPDSINDALQNIPDGPLSKDVTIPPFSKSIVKSPEAKVGGVPLSLNFEAQATVGVDVFNSADDKDANGIFASTADAAITFEDQRAWLKYSLQGSIKGSLGATFGMIGVAVKAGRQISLLNYRTHRADTMVLAALARDLTEPRSILDLDHVRALAPGEALSMQIEGNLSAVVKFSWADAFSSAATELTKILSSAKPIAVKLSAGLTASVGLEVTDDFVFVVSRTPANQFRISVKKAKSRGIDVAIAATLGAEFEKPDDVKTALNALIEGAIGHPLQTIDALLLKVQNAPAALTDDEKKIFEQLVERLHVKDAFDRVQAARDEIAKLQTRLSNAITAVATAKATIGFKYEYSRIVEDSVLLDVVLLDDAALPGSYELALKGEAAGLAKMADAAPAKFKLLQYLNETKLTRKSSFGFTLGLGKHAIAVADNTAITMTTRRDVKDREMIAFNGARSYTEKGVPNPDFTWTVDLKAEMGTYARPALTDQFDFGLYLQLDFPRVRQQDAEKMADFAAMWGAVHDDPLAAQAQIDAFLAGGQGTAVLQLVFDEPALSATLAIAKPDDFAGYGQAFGAAMPYFDTFATRRNHVLRRIAYGPLWTAHFAAPFLDMSLTNWKSRVKQTITDGGLRNFETSDMPNTFPQMVVNQYPHVRAERATFANGATRLLRAISTASSPSSIPKIFGQLQELWSQRQFVVAVGVYFVDLARKAGVLGRATRTLTLARGDDRLIVSSQA